MKFMFWLIVLTICAQAVAAVTSSSYPDVIVKLMDAVPRWTPSMEATPACLESLKQPELNEKLCRAQDKLNLYDSYRSKIFFDFDAEGKYGFVKIDFNLTNHLKVRGLLGLHEGRPRPLVIFRMGIHGNRDEFLAERFLIRLLYHDLGYNVLMLESLTSHGFLLSNKDISVGGLEEGLHTFYILNLLRKGDLDWSDQITSVHLVAISMGGAGAFLTTYLDEMTHRQIRSVQLFCPLVNFQANFEALSKPGWFNAAADIWNRLRLKALYSDHPEVRQVNLWPMIFDLTPRFAPSILNQLNEKKEKTLLKLSDFERKFPELNMPEDFKRHLSASANFYEANKFWSIFKNEQTPIQLVTTEKDLLVFNDLNTEMIRSGRQPGIFKKISYVDLQAAHCSLAEAYQWPFLVEMVKRGLENK